MDYTALAHETADKILALKDMEGSDEKRKQKARAILDEYVITKYLSEGDHSPETVHAARREASHFLTTFNVLGPERAANELRIAGPRPPALKQAESAGNRAKSTKGQAAKAATQQHVIPPSDPKLAHILDQFMQDETQEQKSADGATPVAHGSTASAASATGGSASNARDVSNVTAIPAAPASRAKRSLGSIRRAKPADPKEPFNPPAITAGSVVGSIVVRLGIPLALAAALLMGTQTRSLEYGFFGVCFAVTTAVAALGWLAHWFYAKWRIANQGNDDFKPVAWICRYALTLVALYAITLAALMFYLNADLNTTEGVGTFFISTLGMLWNSGLPISLALFVAVHIANLRYMRWSADMEANEALWWLDAGVRIVRALLYGAAVIAIVASAVLFAPISYFAGASGLFSGEVTPTPLEGPWWKLAATMIAQLAGAGTLGVIILMMIVYTIWRRGSLWLKVQGDREIQRLEDERLQALQVAQALDVPVPNFKPIVRSMKTTVQERVFGLVVALILIVLGVALFATLFSLIQPNPALRVNMLFYLPWTLLTSSPALPLAAVLSGGASLLLAAESQWYQATELKHDFINWLTKVIVVLAVIASIGLAVYAVYRAQMNTNIIGVAVTQFQEALMTPNIWTLLAQTVVRTVFLIVIACIALVVIVLAIAVLAGGGGGSTAGAGAGGGGGGYAGGGSSFGSSSDSKRQSVNDRYGRKLVEVEDSVLFGTSVKDRHGGKIGSATTNWDGSTRVTIGNDVYRVRDAPFSSDKIVEKNGEEVGRIRDSGLGDDRFYNK